MTSEARETYPELATDHVGMRMLWCNVLEHAINEATSPIAASGHNRYDVRNARHWIMTPSLDFTDVCQFAGYEPDRVRAMVAPRIEAAKARDGIVSDKLKAKRNSLTFTVDGEVLTIHQIVDRMGISESKLRSRISLGWSIERAIGQSVQERHHG